MANWPRLTHALFALPIASRCKPEDYKSESYKINPANPLSSEWRGISQRLPSPVSPEREPQIPVVHCIYLNMVVQQHPLLLFEPQPASSKQPTFVVLYAIHDEVHKTMPLSTASNISSYLSSVIPHIPRPSSCPLQRNPPPHNINIPLPIRAFIRPIGPGQDVAGGEMWVQSVGCGGADLAYINR